MERNALGHPIEGNSTTFGVREVLTVLFRHKKKAFATLGGAVLIAVAFAFLMTPIYESTTSLLVKVGREHLYRSEVGSTNERSQVALEAESIIPSEIAILTSQDLIQRVVQEIGIPSLYPELIEDPPSNMTPLEAAILTFEEELKVYPQVKHSNVIKATFRHENPQVASQALTHLLEFLKEKHLQIYSNPKSAFMEGQLAEYESRLVEAESKLLRFKQQHGISSLDHQLELLLSQRRNLDSKLKTIEGERHGLQGKVVSLKHQIKNIPEVVSLATVTEEQHRIIDEAKSRLLALQLEEQELLVKYRETSRLVVKVRKDMAVVGAFIQEQEEKLKDRVTKGKNPIYEGLESQLIQAEASLKGAESERAAILAQLQSLDEDIQGLDQNEQEFHGLLREVETHKENLQLYQTKVEDARISEEMNRLKMANISIIQPATIPAKPVWPKPSSLSCWVLPLEV